MLKYDANIKQKKAEMAVLIASKICFKLKTTTGRK